MKRITRDDIDKMYLEIAKHFAQQSKDPMRQVGAVIVSEDRRHTHLAYNGFPSGIEESDELWQRPTKYNYVCHAENNALIMCPFDKRNCTLYVTCRPCQNCLKMIVQAGIKRLVLYEDFNTFNDPTFDKDSYSKLLSSLNYSVYGNSYGFEELFK